MRTPEKLDKSHTLLLIAFLLGIFIGAMDTGIVSPARTVIENNLNINPNWSIWIITLYTLVYAVAMPISGRLSDLYGKKRIYLFSVTVFMIGSFLCGISNYFHNFGLLLFFRGIQAVGGGGIMPVATAFIGERFPVSKRGTALGFVGAIYGIATLLGPTLGSVILQAAGDNHWGYLFFVNVPICITAILLVLFAKTKDTEARKVSIDFAGSFLLAVVIASLMYAITNINFTHIAASFKDIRVWLFLLLFIVFMPILIITEKKIREPILRLEYFSNRDIALTLAIAFFVGCSMMSLIFVPQFAVNMLKLKDGQGGYVVTIVALFAGLGGPVGGKFIDHFSAKRLLQIGFLTTITAIILITGIVIPQHNTTLMYATFALLGLGMSFTMGTPLNYLIQLFSDPAHSGSAQATLSLIRSIGVAISPNVLIGFIETASEKIPGAIMKVLPQTGRTESLLQTKTASAQELAKMFSGTNVSNIVETIQLYTNRMIDQAVSRMHIQDPAEAAQMLQIMQNDYDRKLQNAAPQIQIAFQQTLNEGFSKIFMMIGIFALAGLILTFFFTSKERDLKKQAAQKDTAQKIQQ